MNSEPEETLDPEDWDAMRALAHRAVDDAVDYLRDVRERPVWQPVPQAVADEFTQTLPLEPEGAERVYEEFLTLVMPFPMGNIHPRFWSWNMGSGTFFGALGDFLASIMNPNLGGGNHVAHLVSGQVADWLKQMVGYPQGASGLLTGGGSMANLIGLKVATNEALGDEAREQGLRAGGQEPVFYGSTEVHSCHQKSMELLGLGNAALRRVAVDDGYRMRVSDLKRVLARDRRSGVMPVAVIATAGTVNTGAVDDLHALADFCGKENLWFHVDGAIGGLVKLSERHRDLVAGLERADSIALDLHKWLHAPFEAGAVLVRDEAAHRRTFSLTPEYLEHAERGLAAGEAWPSDYDSQLTRRFRALKIWLTLKEHGARKFGRLIDQNIRQAVRLAERIDASEQLERCAPVGLNIVCFRFNPGDRDEGALNRLNQELLMRLHEGGVVAPSYTTLDGRYCLRAALANHRTREADLAVLIEEVLRVGAAVGREGF